MRVEIGCVTEACTREVMGWIGVWRTIAMDRRKRGMMNDGAIIEG